MNNLQNKDIFLALGSNKGDRQKMLQDAEKYIKEQVGDIICSSQVYETKSSGYEGADYLNSALQISTELSPDELLNTLKNIEIKMGRDSKTYFDEHGTPVYQERCIDIDILYYDDKIINTAELCVPHYLLHERLFVLQPLCDIAPDFIHPVLGVSNKELLARLGEKGISL